MEGNNYGSFCCVALLVQACWIHKFRQANDCNDFGEQPIAFRIEFVKNYILEFYTFEVLSNA